MIDENTRIIDNNYQKISIDAFPEGTCLSEISHVPGNIALCIGTSSNVSGQAQILINLIHQN